MEFHKSLAKYYFHWLSDAMQSIEYCKKKNDQKGVAEYTKRVEDYRALIENNREAIEFFSTGNNAFLNDSVLPVKFRGYK